MIMKTMIALIASLMITGCANHNSYPKTVNEIPDVLQIGQSLLSRDTIEEVDFPVLTQEQCNSLHRLTTFEVPDSTRLIGIRPIGKTFTLEAYKVPTGEDANHFKVYLVTRDHKGAVVDALDLREFHTSEHQKPMRLGGNRFYTTDASISFNDDSSFTLHRVMTLTSLYLKDHRLTEAGASSGTTATRLPATATSSSRANTRPCAHPPTSTTPSSTTTRPATCSPPYYEPQARITSTAWHLRASLLAARRLR